MPELPEVETVVRGLRPHLEGRRLRAVELSPARLRLPYPADFARRLVGRRIVRLARRAKYILAHLDDGTVLIGHLGMSGRLTVTEPGATAPSPHDHLVMRTDKGAEIRYHDARRFGLWTLAEAAELDSHPLFRDLGPEPLGEAFDGAWLARGLAGRRGPLKTALLNQHLVAGLGNIYACEALFLAGLSPRRRAGTVGGRRAERLAAAIVQVLERAIDAGGSSLRDYVQASGELGYFQHAWAVYDRAGKPCPGCDCDVEPNGGIRRIVQSGRSTFYCPRRQR